MRFLPGMAHKPPPPAISEETEQSIKRAEKTTQFQRILTELANRGKYDRYLDLATGNWPADMVADRHIDKDL